MIYLDNAATTPIYKELISELEELADLGNPSSVHAHGRRAKEYLTAARKDLAALIGADYREIVFTSCGTESNNTAIFGAKLNKSSRIIVSGAEHSSVYYPAKRLMSLGYDVKFAPVNADGTVILDKFNELLDENAALVSIMHVNNETGGVNDIRAIVKAVRARAPRAVIHSDGVQAAGKLEINLHSLGVDAYSISAHKFNAPKGIGALYIRNGVKLNPLLYGGGQEGGMRSATENVFGAVSMAKALKLFKDRYEKDYIYSLANKLMQGILEMAPESKVLSDITENPNILALSLKGIKSEIVENIMSDRGVMIATGSACSSNSANDRIARALSLGKEYEKGILRFSFSMANNASDIEEALSALKTALEFLK